MSTPALEHWRKAFFDLEGNLSRIERASKVLEYLAAELIDAADEMKTKKIFDGALAEVTAQAAFILIDTIKDADKEYYERFNDLVGRENEALKVGRACS